MAFKILEFDRALAEEHMTLKLFRPSGKLEAGAELKVDIPFQFPPIIGSDNKEVDYEEKPMANIEPQVSFKSSKARAISLKWTYIVTGAENGATDPKPWNCAYVAKQVKQMRSFFYQTSMQWATGRQLCIGFRGYDMVGIGPSLKKPLEPKKLIVDTFTFRSNGIKVSYGPTVVQDNSGVFALKTDLEMTIKLWSKGVKDEDGKPMLDTPWLSTAEHLTLDWR